MQIKTSSFGTQTINPEDILNFPNGLLGFPELTQFKLFHEEHENPTVHWLQSITDENVAMSVVSPSVFGMEYDIGLSTDEQELLKLVNPDDVLALLVIYKQHEKNDADEIDLKAIYRAPIFINTKTNIGIQKSLTKLDINEV
ncbi:MAG: flagellar assembly protein FliW [Gammaproteobacteria bacterium]|nr:flagellar assembly protein FliW [Gammaproteobacteria bacterium]